MFDKLTSQKRIELAMAKMERVVHHFQNLIALHENNDIVLYSETLGSQIPKSYAANAFTVFRETMHQMEFIRLCALWDRAELPKESIPTVIELIGADAVIEAIGDKVRTFQAEMDVHIVDLKNDPEERAIQQEIVKKHQRKLAGERADKTKAALHAVVKKARDIYNSKRLQAVRNLRDKQLAHLLAETYREKKGPVDPAKYHDETKLLEESIPIVETLYSYLNGTRISLKECGEMHKGCAEALWNGCTFKVEK